MTSGQSPVPLWEGSEPCLDAEPGPALPLSTQRHQALVSQVLASHGKRGAGLAPRRSRSRLKVAVVVVGSLVSAAAAAQYGQLPQKVWLALAGDGREVVQTHAHRRSAVPRVESVEPSRSIAGGTGVGESAAGEGLSGEVLAVPAEPEVPVVEASLREAEGKRTRGRRRAKLRSASKPLAASRRAEAKALDYLRLANTHRRAGRYLEAKRTYLQVVDEHASTGQLQPALVAAASLALEHERDPAAARTLYQRAAQAAGPLRPEAFFGIAECHRAAGEGALERQALEQYLRRFPNSSLAAVAQSRLAALEN